MGEPVLAGKHQPETWRRIPKVLINHTGADTVYPYTVRTDLLYTRRAPSRCTPAVHRCISVRTGQSVQFGTERGQTLPNPHLHGADTDRLTPAVHCLLLYDVVQFGTF